MDITHNPVFIIGCPRSGNTLLGAILNKHPDMFVLFEANIFSYIFREWHTYCQKEVDCLADLLYASFDVYHSRFGISYDEIQSTLIQTPVDFGILFDRYMQLLIRKMKPSAQIWGDKTPHHLGYIDHILSIYPDARFIYTYREPRNVVQSLSKDTFPHATANQLQNAVAVKRYLSLYETQRRLIPSHQLLEVRYEELAKNPERITRQMCDFLNISYEPDLLLPASGRVRTIFGWPEDKAWGSISPQKGIKTEPVSAEVDLLLHNWSLKQGYETSPVNYATYRRLAANISSVPYLALYFVSSLYWKTKYPDFPFLQLKIPYVQK